MKFVNRLERQFGNYAIPNLTVYLIVLQALAWLLLQRESDEQGQAALLGKLALTHDGLMRGEVWRLFTVLMIPPLTNLLFLAFALYMFFIFGSALENQWGTFRYNLYFFVGYVATVLAALIPRTEISGSYLLASIFLAFAWLFPEYPLYIFFILPVKVKWLGLLTWISFVAAFFMGGWSVKAEVLAGVVNFLVFFHEDLWQWAKTSRRKFRGQIRRARDAEEAEKPMHVCAECGVSDKSDRTMEFRYCPLCTGTPAYCIEHIHTHKHR